MKPSEFSAGDIVEETFQFPVTSSDQATNQENAGDAADSVFNSASLLPSDTMPRMLRDELEGIDFYISQGYVEIGRAETR